ncbi:MAG: hypothetical protein KJP00_07330 [Bacteroidia bacterium]|nr:hypothetical protein [Bacteroidia bacterium]
MPHDLERYIREHRGQLDHSESLDLDAMWTYFEQRQRPVKRLNWWKWSIAASVILLIGAMWWIMSDSMHSKDSIHEQIAQIDTEMADHHASLVQLIGYQDSLINSFDLDKSQYPELFDELQRQDSLQTEAIKEMATYGEKKNLIRVLLKHYERKARILELILYEIDKNQKDEIYDATVQI